MKIDITEDAPSPDKPGWPARTQRLVDEVRGLCATWLHEPLRACLGDFDRRLHDKSDRTRSHVDQQRYLATRQMLLQGRQVFEERFVASIDRAFAQIGTLAAPSAGKKPGLTLSLLDAVEHELTAALDQLVARNEARNGPLLVELSYRLAVLVAAPPLEGERLPLGPQAMAAAFRDATAALNLPSEHDVLLLQSLESTLVPGLAGLYEIVNRHLLAEGILPRLRAFPMARTPLRKAPPLSIETPAPPTPPTPPGKATAASALDGLREPLIRRRNASPARHDAALVATEEELRAALEALQQRPSLIPGHVGGTPASASQLRRALLGCLNTGAAQARSPGDGANVRIGDEQDDILELVARLLQALAAAMRPSGKARALLGELQLPLLRLALADPGFFEHGHPARQLLETFADAARDWIEDSDSEADRGVVSALNQLVDRTVWEPPAAALYTALQGQLDAYLAQLQRKAQLAERRHVEAMQGHDRLAQARRQAAQLMAERRDPARPDNGLRGLIDRVWTDVLALTLLRHGEQSEAFSSRLLITDQLCGKHPVSNPLALRHGLETGLQQIGMPAEESAELARWLFADSDDPASRGPSTTSLAIRLKQRLGEAPAADTPGDPGDDESDPRVREQLQQLRQKPAGDWFEFAATPGAPIRARKLAWFAPHSGRCLLLNRRGQPAEDLTLAQLARKLVDGEARPCAARKPPSLAAAWRAMTDLPPPP
ncbi:MAG: DUF1631 family protein [Rhodanobacter sp.]